MQKILKNLLDEHRKILPRKTTVTKPIQKLITQLIEN